MGETTDPMTLLERAGCGPRTDGEPEGHRPLCNHFSAFNAAGREEVRMPCARGLPTCPCCRWLPQCGCGVEPPFCIVCFPVGMGHVEPCFWGRFHWGTPEAKEALRERARRRGAVRRDL